MYLENIVFDAADPTRTGREWEAVIGGETLTDEPEGFETRLAVDGGPEIDLCFQRVAEPSTTARLHLDLLVEGTPYDGTGPLAAIRLESADPARDVALWAWLTGWVAVPGAAAALRHPSSRGPVLALVPEQSPKAGKNPVHLDVRLEAGDDPDDVEARILALGGSRLVHDWGELPWRSYLDQSGNEFCVLSSRS